MLFSPSRRVFATILASSLLYLADRSTAAQIITVAKPLYDRVPDCAFRCIQDFIQSEYPGNACSRQSDINCLCRTNTTSGLTLGEGTLRCIFSYCTQQIQPSISAYSICDSVPGALPKTHATITATVPFANPPAATTQIGNPGPISPSFTESTSTHPTTIPVTTSTTSTSSQSTTTECSHSTSPTPTTSTHKEPTHTPESTNTLNSSAVIGISVASGISVAFILGVVVFFCCRRIRRGHRNKENPDFFEIGGFMSEPPEFTGPPTRRPAPGPQTHSSTMNRDQAHRRVMNPFGAGAQNPAVVVTKPDYNRSPGYDSLERIGLAISSESELDTASRSQTTPRTLSDLLPDKPDLYPEPLRYSQQSKSSPRSGETFGPSNSWTDSSRPSSKELGSMPCSRMGMIGLPPNPRAMKQGFGGVPPNPLAPNQRRIPTYANNGDQPGYGAAGCSNQTTAVSSLNREDHMVGYWQDSGLHPSLGHNATPPRFPGPTASYHAPGSSPPHLEPNYIRDSQQSRALTPVREVRTPGNIASEKPNHDYFSKSPSRNPAVHPRNEIVSRPRIVRQDDIKRVQIRRGKPQPKELQVPYSPEDYWLEHSRGQRSMYSGRNGSAYNPPSEHSLTPARRGTDLILRVD